MLKCLNEVESKVICVREFEIILSQTQSLSIKGSLVLRTFQTFFEAFVVEFYINLKLILRTIT